MNHFRSCTLLTLAALLLAAVLAGVTLFRPYKNSPDIRSDGVGYHIWAHAIAHGDLSFCQYRPLLRPVQAISAQSADGQRCRNKYPPGVGLLQLALSWPVLASRPNETGFSVGENRSVLWGGALLLFASATLMGRVLIRRGVSPPVTLVALSAFIFGTGLFHYATYDASFSHIYSTFGVSLAMWLVYERRRLSPGRLVAFAVVAAWLYAVRQTNAALGLAVVYVYVRHASGADRWRLPMAWFAGTAVSVLLLLVYSRYAGGSATISSYGDEAFTSFGGHAFDVLLSYERGVFTYYPLLMVVSVLAAWRWRAPENHTFIALLGLFAMLYGSWHAWSLGSGFGHRGFVELAPFGIVVLAAGLSGLPSRPRHIGLVLTGLCCAVTILLMSAYWRGTLPLRGTVAFQYWQSLSPIRLPAHPPVQYTADDIRHLSLKVDRARPDGDGVWTVDVIVVNTSPSTVFHGVSGAYAPLNMSWRLVGVGAGLGAGWDQRVDLPALEPGESQSVTISVPGPDAAVPGQHLQLAIVQEGIFWSHDIGVPPVSVPWTRDATASMNKME